MAALYRRLWEILVRFVPRLKNLDTANQDLIRRTFSSMLMRIIRTGISFMFNVLLARMLGAEGNGVYALAYAITRISSLIGRIGMDQAVLRFTAAHSSQNEWNKVAGVYRQTMMITTMLSGAAAVIIFLAAPLFAQVFEEPTLIEPMRWMALSILPWSWLYIQGQLLQGLERTEDSIFVQTMGIQIVNIPFLIILTAAYGVTGAAMSYFIAALIISLLGYRLWRRYTPQLRGVQGEFERQTLLRTSIPMFWTDITMVMIGMSDTLLLGVFSPSTAAVGIYDQAKRVSVLAAAFLSATNYVAAPKFAAMHAAGQHDKLGSLARNAARLTTLVSLPYLVLFLLIPGWFMGIFGPEFVEGGAALAILSLGQFISSASGSVGYLLIMTGHEKTMRNITVTTSLFKLALLVVLIPPFGYIGAALATMIGDSSRNLIAVYQAYKKLSIITIPMPKALIRRLTRPAPAQS